MADILKFAVDTEEEASLHDMALIYILKETKNLNQYFSGWERDKLKDMLKKIKKNPQNKQMADMINYVSDITAIVMACIITASN